MNHLIAQRIVRPTVSGLHNAPVKCFRRKSPPPRGRLFFAGKFNFDAGDGRHPWRHNLAGRAARCILRDFRWSSVQPSRGRPACRTNSPLPLQGALPIALGSRSAGDTHAYRNPRSPCRTRCPLHWAAVPRAIRMRIETPASPSSTSAPLRAFMTGKPHQCLRFPHYALFLDATELHVPWDRPKLQCLSQESS